MSRPFSYNDENFTVIDNMLFVHFIDMEAREIDEPVIQVPDEIYKRMCSYANITFASPKVNNVSGMTCAISIILKDGKPYIAFISRRPSTKVLRYYYTIYLLKDI